jgi:hypothetical protein
MWMAFQKIPRNLTIDDHGKFMIIDPYTNCIVAGEKFDLDAKDVIELCRLAE